MIGLRFSTGRESAAFWDKGTTGQAKNLVTGRDKTRDETMTILLSKSGTGCGTVQSQICPMISCFRTSFTILECTFPVLERSFPVLE